MSAAVYSFKGTADMSQHNQQIEKAKQEITKYKEEVDNAQKSTKKLDNTNLSNAYRSQKQLQDTVKNTTTVMNGLTGNLKGTLSKFGPYAAAAAAAIGVAFKATSAIMKQSDEWTDKFKSSLEGATGAANQLAYQIGNMDFTNFTSGIITAWRNARNLYDTLDALNTFNVINDDTISRIDMELEVLRTRSRRGEDVKQLIKKKEKELEQALTAAIPRIEDAKEKLIAKALNWNDITGNNSGWGRDTGSMEKLWEQVLGYKIMDNGEIDRRITDIKRKIADLTRGSTNASPVRTSEAYNALARELHALELSTKITDDQIKEINEQKQSIRAIYTKLAQTERMDLRYTGEGKNGKTGSKTKKDPIEGTLAYIDKEIKRLKDKLQDEVLTIPMRVEIDKEIKGLEDYKAMIQLQVALNGNTNINNAFGDLLNDVLNSGTVEEFAANLSQLMENAMKSTIIPPDILIPSEEMKAYAKETMKELQAIIDEEYAKMCEEIQLRSQDLADSFSSIGSIFSSVGDMMNTETANWASAMGDMLSIVGEVIAKLTALASANGVASAMELPYPANLAAVATVLAGIASAVSTIQSYSNKKYAGGGIIEGNGSRIGDMHLARVNPGEMILNNRQQSNLFHMMNNSAVSGGNVGGNVTFHISGTDLVGVLDNQNRKTKRVR